MKDKNLKTLATVTHTHKLFYRNNERGITLISLAVTIVVLLILAGVTISTMTGENGIIEQSKKEKENIVAKQEISEQKVNELENKLNKGVPTIIATVSKNTSTIKLSDIHTTGYEGTIDSYEYYIKLANGSDTYKKVSTTQLAEAQMTNLTHNTEYKIKIVAKNGTEEVMNTVKYVKTNELICASLNMKYPNNGDYLENTLTNKDIIVSLLEKETSPYQIATSTYQTITGSAQAITSTNKQTTVNATGITVIRVTTTDGTNTLTRDYKIAIDKVAPKLTVTSAGIAEQYPELLTLKSTDEMSKVAYIELPDGRKIQGNDKYELATTFNATRNGPTTFKVADALGNEREVTYKVENVINFETEWTTTATNTTVTVPVAGTVDVYIDYGDGTGEIVTSANPTHTYANAGTYTMKISGQCTSFDYNTSTQNYLAGLKKWGVLQNTKYAFGGSSSGCSKMTGSIPKPHEKSFENITTFQYLFSGCTGLTSIDLNGSNTSKVTNMSAMFKNCSNLASINISELDTYNVTDMSYMFDHAGQNVDTFNIANLSNLDTGNVTTMRSMFYWAGNQAKTFDIGDLSNWNTSKVTNMRSMFNNAALKATSFDIGNLSSWNTSKVTDMGFMFQCLGQNADTWNIGDLSAWNTSKVTNMCAMFNKAGYSASTWNIGNLSDWNTGKVTNMNDMFSDAGNIASIWNIGDLSNWNTGKVTNMDDMFAYVGNQAKVFDIGDLSSWDVSNVTTMKGMFNNACKNATTWNVGNLAGWDTCNVTNMRAMFYSAGYSASTWNIGDLSSWNTSKVTTMRNMFNRAGFNSSTWNIGDLSTKEVIKSDGTTYTAWDTSKVTDMGGMFSYAGGSAKTFNIGNISNWNTANVTNMGEIEAGNYGMFENAGYNSEPFELDLSGWDTRKVKTMDKMFDGCRKLNKITIGPNFKFVGTESYLPVPNSYYITGADGKWYNVSTGIGYTPEEIAGITHTEITTYSAVK